MSDISVREGERTIRADHSKPTKPRRGAFISIEGLEGAGKSTGAKTIEEVLASHGLAFVSTREPGGTELGEEIRSILLAHSEAPMASMTELLLMFAARAEHVQRVIEPALAAGKWLLCDRFTDSSYAYQGGGRGVSQSSIEQLETLSIPGIVPDLTVVLDLPVREGLARKSKDRALDRFEDEQEAFFDRARQVFLARAKSNARYHIVDAMQSTVQVQLEIRKVLTAFVDNFGGDGSD